MAPGWMAGWFDNGSAAAKRVTERPLGLCGDHVEPNPGLELHRFELKKFSVRGWKARSTLAGVVLRWPDAGLGPVLLFGVDALLRMDAPSEANSSSSLATRRACNSRSK